MEGRLGKALTPFDLAKFQALADGEQISIVYLKDISSESNIFRLDAEFFHPQILDAKKTIRQKNGTTLREMEANIIHPTEIKREYAEQGIQILLAQNIRDNYLDFSTKVFMPDKAEQYLEKNKLEIGDIALTRSGANYGQCAAYSGSPSKIFACADDLIIRVNGIAALPKYMATFLNTSFGKTLIESCKYGAAQPHIAPQALYDIPIYIPSNTFIELIDSLITESENQIEQSKLAYQQAQDFLLAELGLDDWQPTQQLWCEKCYSETVEAGRIDAEYYQPKYDEIIKAITEYSGGADRLGNLCDTARGSLISESFYTDSLGKVYIRGADFSGGTLSKNKAVYINKEFTERGETSVKEGDIVFSLIGSVGETALVTKEFSHSYISNNTGKISCTNGINPVVLQVLLKSIIGKMYFEKYKTQTAQPKISDKDTHNFVLPLLPEHKQLEIQEKVMESFKLRERSKKLLENAKRAVEIAIEQDETAAIQFLNSET